MQCRQNECAGSTPCRAGTACADSCAPRDRAVCGLNRRAFLRTLAGHAAATAVIVSAWREIAAAEQRVDAVSPKAVNSSLGMPLVRVPAGTFTMGSDSDEPAKPAHRVTLTKPFSLGVCEVTNAEYLAFLKATERSVPCKAVKERLGVDTWASRMFNADDQPVVSVTWDDAVKFCEWLSRKEQREYRLPTEAEWEYASRAGTTTPFYWGDDPEAAEAKYFAKPWPESIRGTPDFRKNPWGLYATTKVKQFAPNPWGLHDMAGNVWEWVADWHGPYSAELQTDPTGAAEGEQRVTRGGSLFHKSKVAKVTDRRPKDPTTCCRNCGFRLLREA